MRINVNLFAIALLAILSGCSGGQMLPPRDVAVEGKFSISIPGNLVPCNELHDFAPLQYADENSGYFLVGIEEPKSSMEQMQLHYALGDYAYFVETTIGDAFDTVNVSHRDTLEINGLACHTADLYAAIASEEAPLEIYYHLAVFEGKSSFYQLIAWTNRDRQQIFRQAALQMDDSFHELQPELIRLQTAIAD